jgi:alpha-glucosidase
VYDQGSAGDHWVLDANRQLVYRAGLARASALPRLHPSGETRTWWASLYAPYMATGIDGVWNDMNEPADFGGPNWTMPITNIHRGGGGLPPGFARAVPQRLRHADGAGLARGDSWPPIRTSVRSCFRGPISSAGTAMPRCGPATTWPIGTISYWSTTMTLNMGLSAQPFAGPDLLAGSSATGRRSLFARWMGVGVFMPFCRAHSDNVGVYRQGAVVVRAVDRGHLQDRDRAALPLAALSTTPCFRNRRKTVCR